MTKRKKKRKKDDKKKKDGSSSSTSSSGSSSDSSDSSEDEKKKKQKQNNDNNKMEVTTPQVGADSKKRKADTENNNTPNKRQKTQASPNTRYHRIDASKIQIEDQRLKDNSYWAKGGESWGANASQTLLKVKGDRFRHEKTKKKRGSYRGGKIGTSVNSVAIGSDAED